jgi:hypothetical protein
LIFYKKTKILSIHHTVSPFGEAVSGLNRKVGILPYGWGRKAIFYDCDAPLLLS